MPEEKTQPAIPIYSTDLIKKLDQELFLKRPFDPTKSHVETAYGEGQRSVVDLLQVLRKEDLKDNGGLRTKVFNNNE